MKKQPAPPSPAKKNAKIPAGIKNGQEKTGNSPLHEHVMDWEAVFRAIGSPAIIIDPDHTIRSANDATCSLAGKTAAELRGMKCWNVFHGHDAIQPPEGCPMVRLLASGKHETAEMEVAINGGVCLVSCTPVADAHGTVCSVIHIATDITEKKKTERKLLENEERFRKIFTNSPLGIALVTPDFRFFSVNPAWVSMTGYTEQELLKMSFKDITHPDHLAGDLKHILELAAGKIQVYATEKRYIRKDRSILWGLLRVTAIRDADGSLQYFAAQTEDITGRRKVEQDLLHQNQILKTINQLAIEFGSMSSGKSVTDLAVKKLMLLSGAVMTSFSAYDSVDRVLQVTNLEIAPGILEKTVRLLGKRPQEMKIPVSSGMYQEIISNIVGKRKTLTEVSFGEIPPLASTGIHKITGIDHFIGIAYVTEGELYGTSILAIKHGMPDPPVELLESFAHIVAVSLRRYRVEVTLSESEHRYRNIIADTQAGYFQIDTEGRFTQVNPAWLRMHGFSSETEVIGKHFSITQADTDQQAAQENVKRLLQGEKMPLGEFSRRRKDGSVGHHFFSASPVTKEGKIVGLEGFLIDITDRKLAEDALRVSEEHYRSLYRNSAIGIFHSSFEGRFLDVNPALAKMLGYTTPEEVVTTITSMAEQVYAESPRYDAVATALLNSGGIFSTENHYLRRDGTSWFGMLHVRIVPDQQGRPGHYEGFVEDITERKQAEEQRERLMQDLAEKNAELDRFTYTVSHDLKSPLITIRSYLSLLDKDMKSGDSDRIAKDMLRISESAEKLEHLITTLLALSRSGRTVDMPALIPFADLVREAGGMLETTLQQRGIALVLPDDLPVISGDRHRLLQVMTNLLDNAVKFMGDQTEPRVEIGVSTGTRMPVFFVKDNGMGFKEENLTRVFGLYERFNPEIPGSGIGLATVRRIIEAHGGKIWVESAGEGKGTTFRFTLPVA